MGHRALVIAGGLRKEAKLRVIQQRFGIEAEWHEIDSDAPRDVETITNRIRSGRVGAVILLTGLMGHKVREKIVQACAHHGVPFVSADTGGTGSIEHAFTELERKLTPRDV